MKANALEVRRWTRAEYDRIVAAGVFEPGERAELVDGEILRITPQGSLHATAIQLAQEALRAAFGRGFYLRAQLPLALDPDSEPEPDVAVVAGSLRDYREAHPRTAVLVLEVSDATLGFDRPRKGCLYARAGIAEYWIIDLARGCVEVHRDLHRRAYRSCRRVRAGVTISPLAAPEAQIAASDLLP